jgi:phosphoenolpyruvate carboxykinase (GTP)
MKRCFGEVDAREAEIGYLPKPEDINLEGTDVKQETLEGLLTVDETLWRKEAEGIREFYAKFGDKLPKELSDELSALEGRLHMHE